MNDWLQAFRPLRVSEVRSEGHNKKGPLQTFVRNGLLHEAVSKGSILKIPYDVFFSSWTFLLELFHGNVLWNCLMVVSNGLVSWTCLTDLSRGIIELNHFMESTNKE